MTGWMRGISRKIHERILKKIRPRPARLKLENDKLALEDMKLFTDDSCVPFLISTN